MQEWLMYEEIIQIPLALLRVIVSGSVSGLRSAESCSRWDARVLMPPPNEL